QQEYDALRQAYIESLGLRVLRFTNGEVLQQMEAVLEVIGEALLSPPPGPLPASSPPPNPLPALQGGGTLQLADPLPALQGGGTLPTSPHEMGRGEGEGSEPDWPPVDVIVGN